MKSNRRSVEKEVVEKLRTAHTGRKASVETRERMRRNHGGGRRPRPWKPWEDDLLRDQLPVQHVAQKTKRSARLVQLRKEELGIPDGRSATTKRGKK